MRVECEGPTFGISLTLLCERSGVEVPLILGDILRWLAAHALAQPDVFAEAPRCAATSQIKSAVDTGASLVELAEGIHPAVIGSLLKRWLEELPDPLLNWDQQVELLSACKDEGCIEARIASLNDAVALVDHISLGTLKPLLLFLQQYCFRQRRFDQQLLQVAVAFAPILFPAALAAGPAELRLAEETVATLVSNALHVFNPTLAANVPVVTPQALCEAAAEIMESQQQQQPNDGCLGCVNAVGLTESHHNPRGEVTVSVPGESQTQPLLEQVEQDPDGPPYEPYLQDAPFLASLHEMVDSCVVGALFCFDDPAESEVTSWAVDDDCGSMTSSCSNVNLSGGGAASSGGSSSCGGASAALSQGDTCHPAQQTSNQHQQAHHHHHHQQPHHNHHHSQHHHSQHGGANGAAQADAPPYSPRAILVTPLGGASDKAPGGVAATVKAAPTPVSPAALAELAQREVAEGSVFCIISAQPGGGGVVALAATTVEAAAAGAVGGNLCVSGKKGGSDATPPAASPLSQLATPDASEIATPSSLQLDTPSTARSATSRRPTEGGAAGVGEPCAASRPQGHTHGCGGQQLGESRQRRMTMGGGDGASAAGPAPQPKLTTHGGVGSVGSAVAALYQHLPQLRNRPAGSGSPHSTDRQLPPPASTSPSSSQGGSGGIGGCVADLGVAGHLRVTLTSGLTLAVRELSTPDAMAHRIPIRSMSAAAMQGEKERLKRQLKDVAAAYEALAGRSLTQALKEPLRPVYVRYHKIKALLSSGRAVPGGVAGGGASSLSSSSGRTLQRPVVSTRPSVVA